MFRAWASPTVDDRHEPREGERSGDDVEQGSRDEPGHGADRGPERSVPPPHTEPASVGADDGPRLRPRPVESQGVLRVFQDARRVLTLHAFVAIPDGLGDDARDEVVEDRVDSQSGGRHTEVGHRRTEEHDPVVDDLDVVVRRGADERGHHVGRQDIARVDTVA